MKRINTQILEVLVSTPSRPKISMLVIEVLLSGNTLATRAISGSRVPHFYAEVILKPGSKPFQGCLVTQQYVEVLLALQPDLTGPSSGRATHGWASIS